VAPICAALRRKIPVRHRTEGPAMAQLQDLAPDPRGRRAWPPCRPAPEHQRFRGVFGPVGPIRHSQSL